MEEKTVGQLLREKREEKKLTFPMVNEETRISPTYLQAMENDNFSIIPAEIYRIGFLRRYADYLGLDAQELVAQYRRLSKNQVAVPSPIISLEPVAGTKDRFFENIGFWKIVLFFSLITGVIVFVFFFNQHPLWQLTSPPSEPGLDVSESKKTEVAISTAAAMPGPVSTKESTPISENLPLDIKAVSSTWIKVVADDVLLFEGLLNQGEEKHWTAKNKYFIRIGYIKGVRVKFNNQIINLTKDTGGDVKDLYLHR